MTEALKEPQIIRLETLDLSYEIEDIVFHETGISVKNFTDKLQLLEKEYKEKYKDKGDVHCNVFLYQYYDEAELQFLVYTIETPEQVKERLDKLRKTEEDKAKDKMMKQLLKLDEKTRNEILNNFEEIKNERTKTIQNNEICKRTIFKSSRT
jgi:hypothetical protein